MRYIDLTHPFTVTMPTYPGDPAPELRQVADIKKEGYTDHQITSVMHVGTHIDAPLHMIEDGKKLTAMPIEKFIGRGALVDARGKAIDASLIANIAPGSIDILLVLTGFSAYYGQQKYFDEYPEWGANFAARAVELGVQIIGSDTPSPDRAPFPVHKLLLGKEVLIIENLTNLESLVGAPAFEVIALPVPFDADAAPARVVARIP